MANFTAVTRSNYFAVKDAQAFETFCTTHQLEFTLGFNGTYSITSNTDDHSWPMYTPDGSQLCLGIALADHLQPGWVAILMEIGNEGSRYLMADALAVNCDGDFQTVSLWDIMGLASQLGDFTTEPRTIGTHAGLEVSTYTSIGALPC